MKAGGEPDSGWAAVAASGHLGQIILLSFGVWLHAADELMVSTVTPAMIGEIGGEPFIAWLIALYEIGSILAGAASVLVVLKFGSRYAMSAAAFIYFAGCLVSGSSVTMLEMLAGRLVQGLGGGAMIAISFAAVHRIIPERFTTRVYAIISIVWGVSAFAGPMIGAVFADAGFWRGAFAFYAVQSAVFGVIVWYRLRDTHKTTPVPTAMRASAPGLLARIGVLAAGVLCIASAGTVDGVVESGLLVVAGVSAIAIFLRLDGSAGEGRMLPTSAWNPDLPQGAVLAVVLLLSAATIGLVTYGPIILTRVHGLDALAIGMILLFESVGWSIAAVATSGVALKHDRILIIAGFGTVAFGALVLWLAMAPGPLWLIAAGAIMLGGGFGAAWAHMVRRATAIVPESETDRIATALPTVQRLGYALGAAFSGIVANSAGMADARTAADFHRPANWIFGLLLIPALAGMAAVLRFARFREISRPQQRRAAPKSAA